MSASCKRGILRRGERYAALLLCAFLLLFSLSGCSGIKRYSVTYADVFDTVTSFTAYARSRGEFDALAEKLHQQLVEDHRRFDIYHEYPGMVNLCTVNRTGADGVAVDAELMDLLCFGKEIYTLSGGKLNIAMGTVLALWLEARENAAVDSSSAAPPTAESLRSAAEHCDIECLDLHRETGTVRFLDPDLRLDVGAIAKGWAQARAMEMLETSGISAWLLNMGGSVCCGGAKPDGSPWIIGLEDPMDKSTPMHTFSLSDLCAVTSGVDQRYFMAGDTRYHHLIDPDTAYPGTLYTQVTVLLPDPAMADALSTALFLLEPVCGKALAAELGAEAFWIMPDGSSIKTDGFPDFN